MEYIIDQLDKSNIEISDIKNDLINIASKYTGIESRGIIVSITKDMTVFEVKSPGGYLFGFKMSEFPGCCGIMVSFNTTISTPYRGKGLGTELNKFKQSIARKRGYTLLMCAVTAANAIQRKILENGGWDDIHSFTNDRTSNLITVSCINLITPKKVEKAKVEEVSAKVEDKIEEEVKPAPKGIWNTMKSIGSKMFKK